jgi:signal peptidase I
VAHEPRIISSDENGPTIWLDSTGVAPGENILLTISAPTGQSTYLISGDSITPSKASHFVDAPIERVPSPTQVRYLKMSKSIKIAGYVLASIFLAFSVLSFANVTKARIVLTASMAPVIQPGNVIITVPAKYRTPHKGDIVAYTARRFNGDSVATISHRIIGGDGINGFLVKGDQNPSPDVQKPKLGDIQGVVIFIIPFIGKLLTPKALFLIIPGIIGTWLILDSLKNAE